MNDDIKMGHIGAWLMVSVIILTVGLQVCYRTQNSARARVKKEIVKTQQEIAERQANFASYVRPEILRNLVIATNPKAEVIGFNKTVQISDIPFRNEQE